MKRTAWLAGTTLAAAALLVARVPLLRLALRALLPLVPGLPLPEGSDSRQTMGRNPESMLGRMPLRHGLILAVSSLYAVHSGLRQHGPRKPCP